MWPDAAADFHGSFTGIFRQGRWSFQASDFSKYCAPGRPEGHALSHYARNHLQDDWAGQARAETAERRREAEAVAGWYLAQATRRQQAVFDAAIRALSGASPAEAGDLRHQARANWQSATQEARAMFDETVACLLACGEVSESLDERWTALSESGKALAAE